MEKDYKTILKIGKYIIATKYFIERNWDTEIDYRPIYKKWYVFIGKEINLEFTKEYKKIFIFNIGY